ncbi:ABC transporter ATP-binding protein [Paenibacillus alvei]|uniref:ABC transporter ATP-binding protein n=1 Tax=Paenibacillus alvei TaxID=44250 RepID=UPI0022832257|nr:ABC transporter ATP-binding protein [Paenibacillus alvei]MCY7487447.1 ABC transporter ATP-binding protein/permease [Paenibacillus alvei]
MKHIKIMLKLFKLLFKISPFNIFLILLLVILLSFIPILITYNNASLINNIVASKKISIIIVDVVLICVLTLTNVIIIRCKEYIQHNLKRKLTENLEIDILTHIYKLPYIFFEEPSNHDKLDRSLTGLQNHCLSVFNTLLDILRFLLVLVSYMGLIFDQSLIMGTILLILFFPTFIMYSKENKAKYNLFVNQTQDERVASYLNSILKSKNTIKEVKIYTAINFFLSKWVELYRKTSKNQLLLEKKYHILNIILYIINNSILYTFIGVTAYLATTKDISIGIFVAMIQAIAQIDTNTQSLARSFGSLTKEVLHAKFIFDFLGEKVENDSDCKVTKSRLIENEIRLNNLCFSYPNKKQVLSNISLEIKKGEKIAIVGENGAGKTTLIKCILKLYPVEDGMVSFDGISINNIKDSFFYEKVSAVFQDYVQYQLTVKENIMFDDSDGNRDLRKASLIKTGLHDYVTQLPLGEDTLLGYQFAGGHELSIGQWQKLSLSRAFYKNSELIILDEPTASLDPFAEEMLFKTIDDLTKDKTTIFISHRLSSCRYADKIVVLDNGTLSEVGSHSELLCRDGLYKKMYATQENLFSRSEK